jgi:hypothetical protein
MEELYQSHKRIKTERDVATAKLAVFEKTPFASETQRLQAAPAASAPARAAPTKTWKRVLPRGMTAPTSGKGMQHTNPSLWKQLAAGPAGGGGMGWFSEPTLCGKQYDTGRKPRNIN